MMISNLKSFVDEKSVAEKLNNGPDYSHSKLSEQGFKPKQPGSQVSILGHYAHCLCLGLLLLPAHASFLSVL